MRRCPLQSLAVLILLYFGLLAGPALAADAPSAEDKQVALERDVTQGALRIVKDDATVVECPLKHTDVQAEIAGFIARVKVTQTFINPTSDKIEAVYVFPLPHEAAVDDMTMVIAERRIVGVIQRREEARRIYEQALLAGQTAALLEQERPNIFTQSVGNIGPGQEINIEISYVDVLRYDVGSYEFQFPMVVGPRYNPGAPLAAPQPNPPALQGQVSPATPDTTRVPDASRISPPVLKPGVRNGHDITLRVKLDAGVPVQDLTVANHQATIQRDGDRRATIALDPADSLPNKDFVLRYDVTGKKPEMAVLTHTGKHSPDAQRLGEGYFMLMIQPQEDERLTKSPPREIVFLVDVSGSMSGEPTAKVIGAMQNMLKLCRPIDTVQVITFASQAFKLFERPVPVTEPNIKRALNFTAGLQGGGGTEMLKGVKLAIDEPLDQERIRIVVMLTDGYIGNEAEIIAHVGKNCGDRIRFWAIGIGSSPNMFLIDGVARQGGGMGKQLGLQDDSAALTQEIMTRIQRAQLAQIKLDWGPHQVVETFPAKLPELWAGRPVIVYGRYVGGTSGPVTISGNVEGESVSWPLQVSLPAQEPAHEMLAKVWARQKIESLMQATYYGGSPAVEEEVTSLALDYRLMSQYTSFVAVDAKQAEQIQPAARPPRRMLVPVPLPAGTRWEGFFGEELAELESLAVRDEALALKPLRLSLDAPAKREHALRVSSPRGAVALGKHLAPASGGLAVDRFGLPQSGAVNHQWFRATDAGVRSLGRGLAAAAPGPGRSGGVLRERLAELSRPSAARPVLESRVDWDAAGLAFGGGMLGYAALPIDLSQDAGALLKAAREAAAAGQEAQQRGEFEPARSALLRAWFLASAALAKQADAGPLAEQTLSELEAVHGRQVAAWTKDQPDLAKRLDLVLRDRSLAESLETIATATGATIRLVPGSVEDVTALSGMQTPRITYLDLRGATVAQALDWILQPAGLRWRPTADGIVAGSDRRSAGESAWVYELSQLAWPSPDELKAVPGDQQIMAIQKAASDLLTAVRGELKLDGEATATWFSPGQLLVIANAETHAAAQSLFDELATAPTVASKRLAELRAVTSRRAAQNRPVFEQQAAARQLQEIAGAHRQFGWQLLAAAAVGRVDLEALTELQLAWHSSQTERMLSEDGAALVLRSLWTVTESSRALPECEELAVLGKYAREQCRPAVSRAREALEKEPGNLETVLAVLYSALAMPDDAELRAQALGWMTRGAGSQPQAAAFADALLSAGSQIDRAALEQVIAGERGELAGDDSAVLLALAARRTGGDTWQAFRARLPELLRDQALSGHVVVLLNRLANPALPLVAKG